MMKLRLLNTTHFGFSFFSSLIGVEIVSEAMKNKYLNVCISNFI